jgi:hypothetical protein
MLIFSFIIDGVLLYFLSYRKRVIKRKYCEMTFKEFKILWENEKMYHIDPGYDMVSLNGINVKFNFLNYVKFYFWVKFKNNRKIKKLQKEENKVSIETMLDNN